MSTSLKQKLAIFVSMVLICSVAFCGCEQRAAETDNLLPNEVPQIENSVNNNDTGLSNNTENKDETTPSVAEKDSESLLIGNELFLSNIKNYAGVYMEDGSNEIVTNVMSVTLTNGSGKDLQLARIALNYGDSACNFEATNIPAGSSVTLLEKERQQLPVGEPTAIEIENIVFFKEKMDVHDDVFEITGLNSALNVRNISNQDISSDIYIYYKYTMNDVYYGGITFRAKVEGGLAAGEIRQVMTGHYNTEGCVITMVTYGA